VLLAGKINLEGELFLSKNMPYTIETLSIEFNRDPSQIKLALELFIELQMIELTETKVYKVKNFAKHQNIKVKDKEAVANNTDDQLNKDLEVEINGDNNKDKGTEQKVVENSEEQLDESKVVNLEAPTKDSALADAIIGDKINGDTPQKDISTLFNTKKIRKRNNKKKDTIIDINITGEELSEEEVLHEKINGFTEGDIPLSKDETILLEWSFG
jgi:hypothetical protein